MLGLVLVAASPLINALLRLDSLVTAALIGITAVPLTVMGGQAGILQGERRWTELSLVYLAAGVPRLVLGTLLLMSSPTETNAMLGVMLGSFVPVADRLVRPAWPGVGPAGRAARRLPHPA